MLTLASLLAAMTIAGAFWVGILAARRLRDWGDGRRQLSEGEAGHAPLALAAGSGAGTSSSSGSLGGGPGGLLHDATSRRIRERVAQRLQGRIGPTVPRTIDVDPEAADLGITGLRQGDVVSVETGDPQRDGDYLVDGVLNLREGAQVTVVAVMTDSDRTRWLVGAPDQDRYLLCEAVRGHGLSGEPPRHILHADQDYALERRGQSSAAGVGMHGRPALPRVATYVYRAGPDQTLWLERWGDQVLMGAATSVSAHDIHFLPGS
ncbi:MAG: DUF4178 domain-containing protein [Myxococcales bacterium]|nr:DUF4178 domain-containing protein [Myxococcales bacterium]